MKTFLFLLVAGCIVATGFTVLSDKNLARVKTYQGFYLFMQSEPVQEYEVLGTVKKTGIVMSDSPDAMLNTLVKRTAKDFPQTEGIIFDDATMEHATCIKFK